MSWAPTTLSAPVVEGVGAGGAASSAGASPAAASAGAAGSASKVSWGRLAGSSTTRAFEPPAGAKPPTVMARATPTPASATSTATAMPMRANLARPAVFPMAPSLPGPIGPLTSRT